MLLRSSSELADEEVAGFAVDDTDETVVTALADDGVDFLVADLGALLGCGRTLADVSFAGETAAAVVGAVVFAALLAGATKVGVQGAAQAPISPDVAVDRLVADAQGAAQPAADLLGAPPLPKQGFDTPQMRARKALITPGARATAGGALDSLAWTVAAVEAGTVALEFAADRAAVAAQLASDLGLVETLLSPGRENKPFLGGDLAIGHRRLPCLGG